MESHIRYQDKEDIKIITPEGKGLCPAMLHQTSSVSQWFMAY